MKWLVPKKQKLIQFLQQQIDPSPSGKLLRRVLEARLCRVDGTVERFGSAEVMKGAVVELSPSWRFVLVPNFSHFEILYEDDDLLVIDKPAGWVCSDSDCLKTFGPKRYLVHRLDKETTGVLLIAKSHKFKDALVELFRVRGVEKLYYAIADGVPKEEKGVCKSSLVRIGSFEGQTIWGSRSKGLLAETRWKIGARAENASLLICQPITGRTHQIRVHLAEMGHPILVDRQYAKSYRNKFFATRPLLHAARIRFRHPFVDKEIDFSVRAPADFQSACETLGLCTTY